MDSDGADRLFILVCVLIMSLVLNVYFAHGIWTANRSINAHSGFSLLSAADENLVFASGALRGNVDELLGKYEDMREKQERLSREIDTLSAEKEALSQRLRVAKTYLYGRSHTHYLYYLGKGVP